MLYNFRTFFALRTQVIVIDDDLWIWFLLQRLIYWFVTSRRLGSSGLWGRWWSRSTRRWFLLTCDSNFLLFLPCLFYTFFVIARRIISLRSRCLRFCLTHLGMCWFMTLRASRHLFGRFRFFWSQSTTLFEILDCILYHFHMVSIFTELLFLNSHQFHCLFCFIVNLLKYIT